MQEAGGALLKKNSDATQSGGKRLVLLALLPLVLLFAYYWPCLCGKGDFYVSDITFYFQPFCEFIGNEARHGRLAMWNPYLYCGMSQLASPNPGILYPLSWFMFLFPISPGLSLYMIAHQLILAIGSYLYLRQLKASRISAIYGASVLTLCAYSFSLIRNMTLPASIAWLPLGLFFERKINTDKSERTFAYMLGLSFCVAMIVYVARPEVGVPELLLLFLASIIQPVRALLQGKKSEIRIESTLYKLASLGFGVALALPSIVPGIEWTSLSPRAQGLAKKWVLMWSANWYDFLSLFVSQPLGDLCILDERTAQFRHMVLSRGSHIPFLTSSYISPIVLSLATFAAADRKYSLRWLVILLLTGFSLMAAGNYTPFAPALVGLSPFFSAFRYPVKLLIFPCLLLTLLAVRGLDMVLREDIPPKALAANTIFATVILLFAVILLTCPQLGLMANHWRWLFAQAVQADTLAAAQHLMGISLLYAAFLVLLACLTSYATLYKLLKPLNAATLIACLTCATLFHSNVEFRLAVPGGFFQHKSTLATKIEKYRRDDQLNHPHVATPIAANKFWTVQSPTEGSVGLYSSRLLNLYFDPLSVPDKFKSTVSTITDENFFQYARELLLYNACICWNLPSSYGYEASETGDYKNCFTEAISKSEQCKERSSAKPSTKSKIETTKNSAPADKAPALSDLPIHRFAAITATGFVNTQVFRNNQGDNPLLDKTLFRLVDEDRALNYRIYRVLNARPRIYFSNDLLFLESFGDLQKIITATESVPATELFDSSNTITYLLRRDLKRFSKELTAINASNEWSKSRAPNSSTELISSQNQFIEIAYDDGQELKLNLATDRPSLLVIADHFYPGFVAELDGKKVEILKTNIFNRAVLISEGSHKLRVYYSSQSFTLSIVCSAIAMFLFVFCYIIARKCIFKLRESTTTSGTIDQPRGAQ